jgi:hypothetical protein
MKIFNLYFYIRFGKPYFVKPEHGEKMWQLHLGFLTISRMDDEQK